MVVHKILVVGLFAAGVIVAAQTPPAPCCNCGTATQSAGVICLSAKDMRDHVEHIEPLKPSGLHKSLNLAGTVVVEIRFKSTGKVACVRAKSGHPIAISAAMEAVPKWTFKPVRSKGAAKAGCGQITIKYRLSDEGSTTELQ